jgi:hypothetical protein
MTHAEVVNAIVTDQVIRLLAYKYTEDEARAIIGPDVLAYLNTQIDARVAEGGDRAALLLALDVKYIQPAERMLNIMGGTYVPDAPKEL